MGHRNWPFPNHFLNTEEDGQGHSGYGDVPIVRSFMPPSNRINLGESSLLDNTVLRPPQADIANLDLSMAVPVHGANEQLSLSNAHRTENYPHITSLLDNDPLKRKSNLSEGPSSSANPWPIEYDDSRNSGPFVPFETGPIEGQRDEMGQEAVIPYSADPWPVPYQSSPWTDMQFGASNGEVGSYLWPPAPPQFPYMNANPNGAGGEGGCTTVLGQQLTPSTSSSYGLPYIPFRGLMTGITYLSDASSSQSIPTGNSWNAQINADGSYVFVSPIPPPFSQLHRREQLVPRPQNSPGSRVEDETDTNSSQETAGSWDDQHNDMRMDIDDMSYEELLALEEAIGHVMTGLSEDFIQRNLKSRTVTLSGIGIDLEDLPSPDQQILHLCTVCQNEYEVGDAIGSLDCGHEYHKACIEQWLVIKNTCPVCKATALSDQDQ